MAWRRMLRALRDGPATEPAPGADMLLAESLAARLHAVGAHRPPLVVIAAEPELREIGELVVVGDEREQGRRALLNYGHTLAHALETIDLEASEQSLDLRHGEAVAIGLMFAAELAFDLGRISEPRVHEHRAILGGLDLDGRLPGGLSATHLVDLMRRDKKADHDLTFILDGPDGIEVVNGLDPTAVRSSLERMGATP